MFALFIAPFDFDLSTSTYAWVVHKAVERLSSRIALVSSNDYWSSADEIIRASQTIPTNSQYDYLVSRNLKVGDFESLIKLDIDKRRFSENHLALSRSKSLSIIQDELDEYLFSEVCDRIEALPSLKAGLMWSNCETIRGACEKYGIPTIFNEMGPLRPPNYHPAAYMDFGGLHHRNTATERFERFKTSCTGSSIEIMELEKLIYLLRSRNPEPCRSSAKYTGIALQSPGYSSLKYSNGFTNYCLIHLAQQKFSGTMLVRPHPGQAEIYPRPGLLYDDGQTPDNFISKIYQLITVNSGIAFEALLAGKPTYLIGESPIKYGTWDLSTLSPKIWDDELIVWLNWFAFGYLIPFQFLFDGDYYDWRLTYPSETEIYDRNIEWWKKHGGPRSAT